MKLFIMMNNVFTILITQNLKINFVVIAFLLLCYITPHANAQVVCGTELTENQLNEFNSIGIIKDKFDTEDSRRSVSIGLSIHIGRLSNGTKGLEIQKLREALRHLNELYKPSGLSFYILDAVHYINSDKYFYLDQSEEEELGQLYDVENTINLYFFETIKKNGNALCGWAYYPGGPDRIIMNNSCTSDKSSLAHELGHYFFLVHTHGTSNSVLTYELADGSNCETTGDRICDTPADPKLSHRNVNDFCLYNDNIRDRRGDLFEPDPTNIMSYSRTKCRTTFSEEQYDRISQVYTNLRPYLKTFPVAPLHQNVGADEGETKYFINNSHEGLNVTTESDWLTVDLEKEVLTVKFDKNNSGEHRTATLKIRGLSRSEQNITLTQSFDGTVSIINHPVFKDISIFPNPARESLNIKFEEYFNEEAIISLIDYSGKTILSYKKNSESKDLSIELNNVNSGIYLVSVRDKDGIIIKTDRIYIVR